MAAQSTLEPGRARVALLCLDGEDFFYEMYSDFITELKSKADVQDIKTQAEASAIFTGSSDAPSPSVILAIDAGLARKNASRLISQADDFVKGGGTLIFAGIFSSFCSPPEFKRLFSKLGLPWETGKYQRSVFVLNQAVAEHVDATGLTRAYSQKALHAKHVAAKDAIYHDSDGDLTQTPAALAVLGQGKVGYIGDVNNEADTAAVVFAMCGLNRQT